MMADVTEFLETLFDDARAKILELLLSDEHNQDLTVVEDYIAALLNLGYTKDHVKEYLAAAHRQLKASLDFQWNNFADKCEELKWQEMKANQGAKKSQLVATLNNMDEHE